MIVSLAALLVICYYYFYFYCCLFVPQTPTLPHFLSSTSFTELFLFTAHGWICPNGVNLTGCSGNVSTTSGRRSCRNWAAATAAYPYSLPDSVFPNDETKETASNYCRNVNTEIPWCLTTWPSHIKEKCYLSICGCKSIYFIYGFC